MILPREPPRRQLGRGPIGMREVFPSGKRKEGGHYGESRNSSPSGGQGFGGSQQAGARASSLGCVA